MSDNDSSSVKRHFNMPRTPRLAKFHEGHPREFITVELYGEDLARYQAIRREHRQGATDEED